MNKLVRHLNCKANILNEEEGLVEYVASDESLDHDGEVMRADGWRFTHFRKNAPFVDSHRYDSIQHQLGAVVDYKVQNRHLIEQVKWAIDVHENPLIQIGWKMTVAGFLKGVSAGFMPIAMLSASNPKHAKQFDRQMEELGLNKKSPPLRIFLRQEQLELSSVIVPANPNALAKAYKADVISEEDIDALSRFSPIQTQEDASAPQAPSPEHACRAKARGAFLDRIQKAISNS